MTIGQAWAYVLEHGLTLGELGTCCLAPVVFASVMLGAAGVAREWSSGDRAGRNGSGTSGKAS